MYQVGDYVVHENSGVCEIVDIDDMELMGRGSKKTYYILVPVFKTDARVFTPITGANARLRDVTAVDEFTEIMNHLADLEIVEAPNDRVRQEAYKKVIGEFTPQALARVVKTALLRKWSRIAAGKKVMAQDEKVFNVAGKKLFEEMAFAMNCQVCEVQNIFEEKTKASLGEQVVLVG